MISKLFKKENRVIKIKSPVSGRLISIEDVGDKTFASKALGEGVAIIPSKGSVRAPFSGKVLMVANTKHAIGLESEDGIQVIIHIGIDTVKREGEGFNVELKEGVAHVDEGELLVTFDNETMMKEGVDTTVLLIVTETNGHTLSKILSQGMVEEGESDVSEFIRKKV